MACDQGHWEGRILNPDKYFGFVYCVTNHLNGRKYIGKKQFFHKRKGKSPIPSKWETYTGSSNELNGDIDEHGKENFSFTVLKQHKTKGWLAYGEANTQHKLGVLTKWEGDTRVYYNKWIASVKFIPIRKEFIT